MLDRGGSECGQCRGRGVGPFTERERGRFRDPRVVVAQQLEESIDRDGVAERRRRLGGSPANRGVGVGGGRDPWTRPRLGCAATGECTECSRAYARRRVVLHHLGQLRLRRVVESAGAQRGRGRRAFEGVVRRGHVSDGSEPLSYRPPAYRTV